MRAMAAPVLSHLDPDMLRIMDDLRARLGRVFMAPRRRLSASRCRARARPAWRRRSRTWCARARTSSSSSPATSASASPTSARATAASSAASTCRGAAPSIPSSCAAPSSRRRPTSSRWSTPRRPPACSTRSKRSPQIAREHGCLTLVDAVTSLGAHPVDVAGWQLDAVYSCTQKGLGAPSGMAPISFSAARQGAREVAQLLLRPRPARGLLERRASTTTRSPRRWSTRCARRWSRSRKRRSRRASTRHRRHHMVLAAGLGAMGLELLPPEGERLWTLNAVCVPDGVDEAAVRKYLLAAVQPRDRRRPRPARRPHLARRPDGQRLEQPAHSAVPERARARAARAGLRGLARARARPRPATRCRRSRPPERRGPLVLREALRRAPRRSPDARRAMGRSPRSAFGYVYVSDASS